MMRSAAIVLTALALSTFSSSAWSEDESEKARVPTPTPLYSPAQLVKMVQSKEPVVFLDVREPEEFAKNHIPGAINMPQRDFAARAHELPSHALVIPYCNMVQYGLSRLRCRRRASRGRREKRRADAEAWS
jgi:hypothetical protein